MEARIATTRLDLGLQDGERGIEVRPGVLRLSGALKQDRARQNIRRGVGAKRLQVHAIQLVGVVRAAHAEPQPEVGPVEVRVHLGELPARQLELGIELYGALEHLQRLLRASLRGARLQVAVSEQEVAVSLQVPSRFGFERLTLRAS